MPSSRQYFEEGLDPTAVACLTKADLLQMLRAAAPTSDIGFLILSETTPDAVTYPELARFGWLKVSTGELKYYNGSSWQIMATAATIPSRSVTIAMLSATGGTQYQILAVNSAGTAVTFQNLISLLATPAYTDMGFGTQKFLTIDGAVCKKSGVDPSAFVAKSITMAKILSAGTVGQVPYADGSGGWTWAAPSFSLADGAVKILSSSKLSASGGAVGQSIRVTGGGYFEFYTPAVTLPAYTCILSYQEDAAVDGVNCGGASEVRVPYNVNVVNTGAIMTNLAASGTFELAAGTYAIDAWVTLYRVSGTGAANTYQCQLYDETGAAILNATSFHGSGNTDVVTMHLKFSIAPAAANTYSIRVLSDEADAADLIMGKAVNLASQPNVYSQITISKIA